jgi:hypothetical protein
MADRLKDYTGEEVAFVFHSYKDAGLSPRSRDAYEENTKTIAEKKGYVFRNPEV